MATLRRCLKTFKDFPSTDEGIELPLVESKPFGSRNLWPLLAPFASRPGRFVQGSIQEQAVDVGRRII
jgi:hypothetical protein